MDIICPRCGEPWDMDTLHEADGITFDRAREIFFTKGCGILFDGPQCPERDTLAAQASGVLYELLGDDIDGIAAMLEDEGF